MLTTCPECHTCFRVSQVQLDQRRGLVRCGRCSAVFNAYDTLLPELTTPQPEERVPPPGAAAPTDAAQSAQPLLDAANPPSTSTDMPSATAAEQGRTVQTSLSDGDRSIAAWPHTQPETKTTLSGTAAPGKESAPGVSDGGVSETSDTILLRPLPTARKGVLPGWGNALWMLTSLFLTFTFLLQITYFLRAEIATGWPETRPFIELACARLGCSLPLPRDVSAVHFESSSLETDPEERSRATLRVTLSNRTDRVVAWPHLILILTDVRDIPIAQRAFPPSEYLTDTKLEKLGLAPGQEQEIHLGLELKGLTAYGYKLDKQYP